jgi:multicomponent Na+:H+ antiporter subunit D
VNADQLLVAPFAIPLTGAVVAMLAGSRVAVQRVVALSSAVATLGVTVVLLIEVSQRGVQMTRLGGWPPPFGIVLVADLLAALLALVAGLIGLAVTVSSPAGVGRGRERYGYYPLLLVLVAGVEGAFLTGDLFNLYVCFEVMLMASFVLLALGGERAQLEGSIKYVSLNLLSSTLFLTGIGLLYGLTGSLNFAELSVRVAALPADGLVTAVAVLFLTGFGIKAAAFPLFFWLPASYHTPPPAVAALFAGLLTKVGVYALLRVFTLVFVGETAVTHTIILWGAVLTMITGVLGAAAQTDMRRVLSFHIVSQIGYMLMGLGLYTPLALGGTVFYLVHHIIVKTNLFLVSGVIALLRGTEELSRLGGMYRERPWFAAAFLVPAFSLAGIPPLSGFWAKLVLVQAGLDRGAVAVVIAALGVSLLTLFSMTKIWAEVFWKADPRPALGAHATPAAGGAPLAAAQGGIAALAGLTIAIGLGAAPLLEMCLRAGHQLMDSSEYVTAILGAR